ncbi:C8orf37 protein [Trinorchestia longiramus]|nr:C8orf37 protein [Trinorchestia longiramus]
MDAEDIDTLLDEVEQGLNKTKKSASTRSRGGSERSTRTATTEDLDLLLTDLPEAEDANGTSASSAGVVQNKKCWPPYLTGSCSSASVRSCPHLHCLKCDSAVVSFDGWQWSHDVSYLFLRNNYPSIEKLRGKLQPSRACRAYACQCRNVTTSDPIALTASIDHTWICTGKN